MAHLHCTSLRWEAQDPMLECAECYRPILADGLPDRVFAYAAPDGEAVYCSLYCAIEAFQTRAVEAADPREVSPVAFRRVTVARNGEDGCTVTDHLADEPTERLKAALRKALADVADLQARSVADFAAMEAKAEARQSAAWEWSAGYYRGFVRGRAFVMEEIALFLRMVGLDDCLPEGFGKEGRP